MAPKLKLVGSKRGSRRGGHSIEEISWVRVPVKVVELSNFPAVTM
jgi:hypothetical protein